MRNFPFEPREESLLTAATDASPWGIGGVLFRAGRPVAWFTDVLHPCDLERFHAAVGDSAFTTLWETFAILVALRAWKGPQFGGGRLALRADSLGAILALRKCASRNPGVSTLLEELALEDAELDRGYTLLTHIPGVSNVLPDALSRLQAPEPKPFPECLSNIPGTPVPLRTDQYYLTSRGP